jgi:hypothetical protein
MLNYGLQVSYQGLPVVNAGSVTNRGEGIFLLANGSVTNQRGGAITGYNGIFVQKGALTVVNAGRIGGTRGVYSFGA